MVVVLNKIVITILIYGIKGKRPRLFNGGESLSDWAT